MNRTLYFDYVEKELSTLATRIELRGGLNLLDLNLHSENFYRDFLNLIFGWKLSNLNTVRHNAPAIDLIDSTNNIVAQVSSTATKSKIESALLKDLSLYTHCTFKFISLSKNADKLRTKSYANPHRLSFVPANDILDVGTILTHVNGMDTIKMKDVYEFMKKELKREPDSGRIERNLAAIIENLAKEDWGEAKDFETIPYDIEAKISFNQLNDAKVLIDDYMVHYHRIDKIYADFDRQGVNRSLSILNGIRFEYLALVAAYTPDQCFFKIIEIVAQKVRDSANYKPIPDEELVQCVQILVVDSFIRCKIFKNPSRSSNAHS